MKYGFFDDASCEYVITTPETPLPWINYLGCKDFFTLVSNTCGGYSFYKDAKLLRLLKRKPAVEKDRQILQFPDRPPTDISHRTKH